MSSEQLGPIAFCWLITSLAVLICLSAADVKATRTKVAIIVGMVFIPPAICTSLAILTHAFVESGS